MKIRSQVGMVLNLDKCIGCHTCSVTCKMFGLAVRAPNMPGSTMLKANRALAIPTTGKIRKSGRAAGSVRSTVNSNHAWGTALVYCLKSSPTLMFRV